MTRASLPRWADEMRQLFRSGGVSQFLLYGNVHDLVPLGAETAAPTDGLVRGEPAQEEGDFELVALRHFLTRVMFEPFDVVIHYDRGRGIRIRKGGDHFHRFLEAFDAFRGTQWSKMPAPDPGESLDLANTLPRDAVRALELINRFLRGSQSLTRLDDDGRRVAAPLKVAVLVEHAQYVAPRAEALHLSGDHSQVLIQLLDWASDPAILGAFVTTVLVTDNLADLSQALVESPYNAKIHIDLPTADDLAHVLDDLAREESALRDHSDFELPALAARLAGLTRVNVRGLVLRAVRNGRRLDHALVTQLRKELIEKQAAGLIEFIESRRTLDDVAGHVEAKAWLRQDAELLRRGVHRAIPMGYLLAGRIGTGKTFLVTCLAGEVGIPVVELKNFRSKWIGATEGNLETIFTILRALGQVIVFVDEADQATGKRGGGDGDSGLSGRIYGMLAKEMSDTRNRGKILWVFATSRPDLVEVDLKRQGRLDVHIPLFPPQDPESRHDLFYAMARKVGLDLDQDTLPRLPDDHQIGGNEMEGILVRAVRLHATQEALEEEEGRSLPDVVRDVVADFRPSAHVERLELMDLAAVKECTDARFLPDRYRDLSIADVNRRIAHLKASLGEF
ncbi:MAG: AAA family ATPase [Acidobacteriota bacterium]